MHATVTARANRTVRFNGLMNLRKARWQSSAVIPSFLLLLRWTVGGWLDRRLLLLLRLLCCRRFTRSAEISDGRVATRSIVEALDVGKDITRAECLVIAGVQKPCTCADLALFTAGDEMPIWADILSCNEFEPEGSYVLHSIVCAFLARRSEGESPALAAIEAAISRANIDRTELVPFLWTSSASQEVVNDIVGNGRPCHRHWRLERCLTEDKS
jgi:hypothetical protein